MKNFETHGIHTRLKVLIDKIPFDKQVRLNYLLSLGLPIDLAEYCTYKRIVGVDKAIDTQGLKKVIEHLKSRKEKEDKEYEENLRTLEYVSKRLGVDKILNKYRGLIND